MGAAVNVCALAGTADDNVMSRNAIDAAFAAERQQWRKNRSRVISPERLQGGCHSAMGACVGPKTPELA
jgi:hypothetical protein